VRKATDIYPCTVSGAGWRATGGSQKVCNAHISTQSQTWKTNRLNN